jgi:integrase
MEKLQGELVAGGLRAKTINHHMSVIRRILESAVQKDLIAKNPARPIKGRATADSKKRVPFTLPEVRALIQAAPDDEWKGLVTLAAHTGMRCGDLLRLKSENVTGTVIKRQLNKGRKSTGIVVTIPLSPPCLAWIDGLTGDFFPVLKLLKGTTISAAFNRIMKAARIAKTVVLVAGENPVTATKSFHSLRHSFASFLAEADVHADVRQKLTGHSSAKVHAGYSHHDEALVRAVATLPSL